MRSVATRRRGVGEFTVLRAMFFTLIFSAGSLTGLATAITPPGADAVAGQITLHGATAILNSTGSNLDSDPVVDCQWTVNTRALDLSPLDNSNGAGVEIHIGTAGSIENITAVPFHGNQENYERPVEQTGRRLSWETSIK